jgi:uncharacterized protein
MKKINSFKNAILLFTFLLIIWGFYRLFFQLPNSIEEVIIKPIIWIGPVIYLIKKEKATWASVGLTSKNLFPAIYSAIALGLLFAFEAFFANFLKYGQFNFNANLGSEPFFISLGISFATAISEEIVFRGFIFTRVWQALNNEWTANLITSSLWVIIHIPITIFINKLDATAAIVYLFLTFVFGIGSTWIYARTKNISSSILLHVLWEWPITLFR